MNFITLTRLDGSPAILNIDRIDKAREMPGNRTGIIYAGRPEFLVREDLFEVHSRIAERRYDGKDE